MRNVPPRFLTLFTDISLHAGQSWDFSALAADLGGYDRLTYRWDLNGDGGFEYVGQHGSTVYDSVGTFDVSVHVEDGDGGYDRADFTVHALSAPHTPTSGTGATSAPVSTPEPTSALLVATGLAGLGMYRAGRNR